MAGESFFLLTHKNPHKTQYGHPRRYSRKVSGVIVVHTAENRPDLDGPDTAAEAVARWIAEDRTDYGSYHRIADSDSIVPMAPAHFETWHETTVNPHGYGISAACRAHEWHLIPTARRHRIVDNLALAAHQGAQEIYELEGIRVPARRITRAQAIAGVPGFIGHGEIDTGRRSDPGPDFDWDRFLATYARLQAGGTIEEDEMTEEDRTLLRSMNKRLKRVEKLAAKGAWSMPALGGTNRKDKNGKRIDPPLRHDTARLLRNDTAQSGQLGEVLANQALMTEALKTLVENTAEIDGERVYEILDRRLGEAVEHVRVTINVPVEDVDEQDDTEDDLEPIEDEETSR